MTAAADRPRFRFPAARRLKLTQEFARVRSEGRTVRGGLLMLGVLRVEEEPAFRIGLVTSRRVGGAVMRNRVRRRLREIVRQDQHAIGAGFWLVIVVRPGAGGASCEALRAEWENLTRRARDVRKSDLS